jgi:AP2-associated kinase
VQETEIIPEIAPMRRGRPGRPHSSQPSSSRPSPSPYRDNAPSSSHDPFAALDGDAARRNAEEAAKRFPSLDQFDILHEKGDKFEFEPTVEPKSEDEDLSKRLTNALADDAFARRVSPERAPNPAYKRPSQASPVRATVAREAPREATPLYQPAPQRPTMVSTGTMTSPAQTPRLPEAKISSRPIYRFPASDHEQRSSSQPWTAEEEQRATRPHKASSPPMSSLKPEGSPRVSSDRLSIHSSSARPSMETLRRPSTLEVTESAGRSRSAVGKGRPLSVQSGARYDLPRDTESSRSSLDMSRMQYEGGAPLRSVRTEVDRESDRAKIASDVEYLRAMEEEESNRKREKRSSGSYKHGKRGSLSNLSLSGGKNLFAGRFGDAFRRFEAGNQDKPSSPSAEDAPQQGLIGASDSTDEGYSQNDESALEDADRDDISPEMRRELERRRLSQEEKRVASAAAEYRRRVAEKGDGGRAVGEGPRSRTIQSKVQSLLGESDKPVVPKTATGYGRFTETSSPLQAKKSEVQPNLSGQPSSSRAPGPVYSARNSSLTPSTRRDAASAPAGIQQSTQRPVTRPAAPPKPKNLQVGGSASRPGTGHDNRPSSQATPQSPGEDWEANFSKRFPSLSGIEMETEIEIPKFPSLRTREV